MKPTFGHSQVAFPLWPICQKFHRRYIELDDAVEQRSNSDPMEIAKHWGLVEERIEAATVTVVFAATYLDQFIYLYGCSHFGIEDCEKEFDRMGLRAKWLKIPERVHGKAIPECSQAIQMLDDLVQVRHKIVHYKLFDMGTEMFPAMEKSQSLAKLTHNCARNSVPTVKSLMTELGKIDSEQKFQKFLAELLAK